MKLLFFAHTPPPHHGQSYMVELILKEFRNPPISDSVECHHVNVQLSDSLQDIGSFRGSKLLRLFQAIYQALLHHWKFGVDALYYIPAPAKPSAVIRDWITLGILRCFYKHIILHWHACGLGLWATSSKENPGGNQYRTITPPVLFGIFDPIAKAITRLVYKKCDLSIALTKYNLSDSLGLNPIHADVIPNGIPDQCENQFDSILQRRQQRLCDRIEELSKQAAGTASQVLFDILYLSHCTHGKGLFIAMEAVRLANEFLRKKAINIHTRLIIGGSFPSHADQSEFLQRIAQENLAAFHANFNLVTYQYVGHVGNLDKSKLLSTCDALIFPVYHPEAFGLVLVEALSFGLPIVTTKWRGIPEIVPEDLGDFAIPEDSKSLAEAILSSAKFSEFSELRNRYLEHYTLPTFASNFSSLIQKKLNRQNL